MSWNNDQTPPPQQQWNQPPQQQQQQQQQQQWGATPPQQGYGAPFQQGYGGPPPQNGGQWGAPSQQQQQPYGASYQSYDQQPPQGQYGGPPPQSYGAPAPTPYHGPPSHQDSHYTTPQYNAGPPNQGPYGGPPPNQNQSYGVPPAMAPAPPQNFSGSQFGAPGPAPPANGSRYLGVSIPAPPPAPPLGNLQGYDPRFDAERIRKATKGFGTDERTIIDTMAPLDAFQMDLLVRTYEQTIGRSLQKTLEKELSGWLEYTLVLLSMGPLGGDVHLLHRACQGAGTHEDLLNEILLGRSNEEMFLLKQEYQRVHQKDLTQEVRGELSMKTERMFNMALSGQRDENPYVNHQLVQDDVQTLYRAGPGKIGTDEIAICGILLSRSDAHLQAIATAFPQQHRVSLSHMISSEFSGHMRDALHYIARGAEMDGQGVSRDAELLEASMAGAGTKDERMIYRIVRNHWNRPRFNAIKNQYQTTHHRSLRHRVEGETTGKYEKALVAIIEQN
ncbi:hypothetical protein BD324DRAFT_623703 [Kockovaella imperatae]|uniref:Annexin n=1 Tax=Kockovaella imperatae TaxID=4999 RepID=A0A1Y1UIM0_9TREE|nr:hypothetical protein BD324DRAFT_623703 [Kockovaella imperatae]ORX37898.1 hypothetical protein BD324DRAFT_623703 [Kockovaella imperatae]